MNYLFLGFLLPLVHTYAFCMEEKINITKESSVFIPDVFNENFISKYGTPEKNTIDNARKLFMTQEKAMQGNFTRQNIQNALTTLAFLKSTYPEVFLLFKEKGKNLLDCAQKLEKEQNSRLKKDMYGLFEILYGNEWVKEKPITGQEAHKRDDSLRRLIKANEETMELIQKEKKKLQEKGNSDLLEKYRANRYNCFLYNELLKLCLTQNTTYIKAAIINGFSSSQIFS